MSVLFDTLNIIGTAQYILYDLVIFCGIFLIFAFEETHDKLLLHKSIIKSCNTFCKNICFDISWKMCELVTVTQTCYNKTILPQFHSITDNYFRNRHAVLLIKNGEEINLIKHIRKYLTNYDAIKINDTPIKNETIAKLKKHLSGKCLNYYL